MEENSNEKGQEIQDLDEKGENTELEEQFIEQIEKKELDDEEYYDDLMQVVRDGEYYFSDFVPFIDFLLEMGILYIRDSMVIYEIPNGYRFEILYEQSTMNPYLKSPKELELDQAMRQQFLSTLDNRNRTDFYVQSEKIDMSTYTKKLIRQTEERWSKPDQIALKERALEIIQHTSEYQRQEERFEPRAYVGLSYKVYFEEVNDYEEDEKLDAMIQIAFMHLTSKGEYYNQTLSTVGRSLKFVDTEALVNILYRTFNPEMANKLPLHKLRENSNFSLIPVSEQTEKTLVLVKELGEIFRKSFKSSIEELRKTRKTDELIVDEFTGKTFNDVLANVSDDVFNNTNG
ncbi:hypothetical protein ESZ50_02220 [Weissella muntiaci]|uniref:Uncharacterized protein n=1 Tax=Weissella muntiaci TaxID=2508881 RepID=A0A6C2CB07_9LACO|nr:hypothetical protein [Weissella muntiaci]TYC50503.1 hypothetical protein ESZ50_02220 [Weissella muntiaci]